MLNHLTRGSCIEPSISHLDNIVLNLFYWRNLSVLIYIWGEGLGFFGKKKCNALADGNKFDFAL